MADNNYFDNLKVQWKKYFGDLFGEFATTPTNNLLPNTSLTSADYGNAEMPVMTQNSSIDYYDYDDYYLDGNSTYNSTLGRVDCDSVFYHRHTNGDCVMTFLTVCLTVGLFFVFGLVFAYAMKRLKFHMKRRDYEECIMMGHIPSVKIIGDKFSEKSPIAYNKNTSANELTPEIY